MNSPRRWVVLSSYRQPTHHILRLSKLQPSNLSLLNSPHIHAQDDFFFSFLRFALTLIQQEEVKKTRETIYIKTAARRTKIAHQHNWNWRNWNCNRARSKIKKKLKSRQTSIFENFNSQLSLPFPYPCLVHPPQLWGKEKRRCHIFSKKILRDWAALVLSLSNFDIELENYVVCLSWFFSSFSLLLLTKPRTCAPKTHLSHHTFILLA